MKKEALNLTNNKIRNMGGFGGLKGNEEKL